ncbi:MAG: adenylate/guanylate cyclase domain-containing protein [Proteobacteria bacterium]|nr:MAG: adenylate/guanylate cyclase domain-containing protein [Pseudomonadota bacterium]
MASAEKPGSAALAAMGAYFRGYGYRILVGLTLTALFALHAARLIDLPLVDQLENMAYDSRLRATMPGGVDPRVVIVDIDEKSLAVEGRWPWSRARVAALVDLLFDHYEVRVLGFDMVFAEPERLEQIDTLVAAARAAGRADVVRFIRQLGEHPDVTLSRSLQERDIALGYYFNYSRDQTGTVGRLPEPLLPAEIASLLSVPALVAAGYGANLELLQSSARAGGFFDNPLNDADGVFRRIPLVQSYAGGLYTSLALALGELALGDVVQFSDTNDTIRLGAATIPVDQDMAALIPYRGPQGRFPYVSASDVLSQSADSSVLKDAIVLVGTTAPGLFDLRNTPVQRVYPGVEIHANVISGILDDRFLAHPDYTIALEMIQVIAIGVLLSFLLPSLGPAHGTLLTGAILLGTVALNGYFWVFQASVVPITAAVLMILLHYVYITSYGFLIESRTKHALMVQFGRYVPEEIVDEMSRKPEHYTLEGERRELSVMFSDIRGFTSLSEKLQPNEVTRLMNVYLSRMTEIIHDAQGTIDKYIGDAIMAFWGAPLANPRHASLAVSAALAMRDAMPAINEDFAARGWPAIRIGIGVNTGNMALGNMGSDFRMTYTVMGDAVNLGSRVESLTKIYGVPVVVTEYTAKQAPGYVYRYLDRVRVRGRGEPIDVLEPVMPDYRVPRSLERQIGGFHAFLEVYRAQRWSQALGQLEDLERQFGGSMLYDVYRARIVQLREVPPDSGWDGVFDLGA